MSMIFIPLIIVGILIFISRINTASGSLKARKINFSILNLISSWNFKHSSVEHEQCFIIFGIFFAIKLQNDVKKMKNVGTFPTKNSQFFVM